MVSSAADIACDVIYEQNRSPYEGVIEVAKNMGADLIVLSSHGRPGIEEPVMGSQATKLLTYKMILALVVR